MKNTLIAFCLLCLVLMLSCSSDDDAINDGGNIKPPHIEKPNATAYVEVSLKGMFLGSVTLTSPGDDLISEVFEFETVDTTFVVEKEFEQITDEFGLTLIFSTMAFPEDYEPASIKVKTKLNDEVLTDMDTLYNAPTFYFNENIKL